jgi:hypothetical protein
VHIAVRDRLVPQLVDLDVRVVEVRIHGLRRHLDKRHSVSSSRSSRAHAVSCAWPAAISEQWFNTIGRQAAPVTLHSA